MKNEISIFFHGDFDGVVSGAIMNKFFSQVYSDVPIVLQSIDYNSVEEWNTYEFDSSLVAVVDFKFSDALLNVPFFFLADHHKTCITEEQLKAVNASSNGLCFIDPTKESCAELIAGFSDIDPELIKCAHIVDGANYESPVQALKMDSPIPLKIAAALSQGNNDFRVRMVKALSSLPAAQVASDPQVMYLHSRYVVKQMQALDYLRFHSKVVGNVGVASFFDCRFSSRYAIYAVHPSIDYAIYARSYQERFYISIARNPWKEIHGGYDLGRIMSLYGGGGHAAVGGVVTTNRYEAESLIDELTNKLSRGEFDAVTSYDLAEGIVS